MLFFKKLLLFKLSIFKIITNVKCTAIPFHLALKLCTSSIFEPEFLEQFSISLILPVNSNFSTENIWENFGWRVHSISLHNSKNDTILKRKPVRESSVTFAFPSDDLEFWRFSNLVLDKNQGDEEGETSNRELPWKQPEIDGTFSYSFIFWPVLLSSSRSHAKLLTTIQSGDFFHRHKKKLSHNSNFYWIFLVTSDSDSDFQSQRSKVSMEIYETYFIKNTLIFEKVQQPFHSHLQVMKRRRGNFKKTTIKATHLVGNAREEWTRKLNLSGVWLYYDHVSFEVSRGIATTLNMTLEAVDASDWITRVQNSDESWSLGGMGAQLVSGEADWAVNISEIMTYRLEQLAPSFPVSLSKIHLFFRAPSIAIRENVYLTAFTKNLWIAIIFMWIFIILAVILTVRIQQKSQEVSIKAVKNKSKDEDFSANVLLWAISAASQQGWFFTPEAPSVQIIFVSGVFCGLFCYISYSTMIVSKFSVDVNIFHSFSDLLRHGFHLMSISNSYAAISILEEFNGNKTDGIVNIVSGLQRVETSKSAMIVSRPHFFILGQGAANYSSATLCSMASKINFGQRGHISAFYFRKGDPTGKFVSYQLLKWKDRGLIFRIEAQFNSIVNPVCPDEKSQVNFLGLQDVAGAFIIFLGGVITSFLLLVMEKLLFTKDKPEKYMVNVVKETR